MRALIYDFVAYECEAIVLIIKKYIKFLGARVKKTIAVNFTEESPDITGQGGG